MTNIKTDIQAWHRRTKQTDGCAIRRTTKQTDGFATRWTSRQTMQVDYHNQAHATLKLEKKERKEIQKKGRNLVSSRWYLSARESPIALRPVSQKCPQCCLWNSSKLMFSWITMTLSRPLKVDRPSLPTSMSLSSRRPKVWCPCSFVPAGNTCLELANTPDLQRQRMARTCKDGKDL